MTIVGDKKMIIVEKPSAAKKLAKALAVSQFKKKKSEYGVYHYEFERGGVEHTIVTAVGHLFNLKQEDSGWSYPVFKSEWVPAYKVGDEAAYTEKYFKTIRAIAGLENEYIVACDLDEEGSLIGANIIRFLLKQENAKRMRFSTLTNADVNKAYENMDSRLDWTLIKAGETRHKLDWLYGVNITRALTIALNKHTDLGFKIISAGRVQTPTLALLVEREKEIRAFQPQPYWQIKLETTHEDETITAYYEKDKIWEENKAKQVVKKCTGKHPKIREVRRKRYTQKPPTPFNLMDFQSEAYRCFKYPPDKTLNILEELYIKGYCSYPRTSSQKLPPKINYHKILKALAKVNKYENLSKKLLDKDHLEPREGTKTDPAHIAIYPTHEPPKEKLDTPKKRIYDLLVKRFLATFAEPTQRERIRVTIEVKDEQFITKGKRTLKRNWHKFYAPYVRVSEKILPEIKEGTSLTLQKVELLEKETRPPQRYSSASLVRLMERKGLGTKATRSHIVNILFERDYLEDKPIKVTQLGEILIKLLNEYCPKITSIDLTSEFEQKIKKVKKGESDKREVINKAQKILGRILSNFKEKEQEIGEQLAISSKKAQENDSRIGKCPECSNDLKIIHSKKTHKRFVGCEGYFKGVCDFSAPLPQSGKIQTTEKKCKNCDYPMVKVFKKGSKSPWLLCINPNCESNVSD